MNTDGQDKHAGVLLHISSLPSGTLGKDAYRFIDFLASTGATVWQTLPINMPADCSPYQCISTHAGNPAFIDLSELVEDGLIDAEDLALPQEQLFAKACQQFAVTAQWGDFLQFCEYEASWLHDFSTYLLLRETHQQQCWNTWPAPYKHRQERPLNQLIADNEARLQSIQFTQYLFFKQWAALKQYAEKNNIKLFGDIPIFVAYDSADVWAQPELFKLDEDREMTVVAGVPPDYFSETGQRWGNPHYNWEAMQANQFNWWLARVETQNRLFHMIRIDHFRGLEAAWEIPAEEPNAIKGKWAPAPGHALLESITKHFPDIALVAEDLGIITDEVNTMRLAFDLPGMKILQFAFDGDDSNPYLPKNIEENSITYTGTHDNDTTLGWYNALNDEGLAHLEHYYSQTKQSSQPDMPYALINTAMLSPAKLVIIPMQDILALDSDHRMNTPGTAEGNWQWRFTWDQLNATHIHQFAESIKQSHRNHSR